MPTARRGHTAVAVNGRIYVMGGLTACTLCGGTVLATTEVYQP